MSKGSKDLLKERNADGKQAIKDAKDIMNELKNMKRLWQREICDRKLVLTIVEFKKI